MGQFFLFWMISFTVFLTSGNGEAWARWQWGVRYDANALEGPLLIILMVMLLAGIALVGLYLYFMTHWERWRREGRVNCDRNTLLATIPFFVIFFMMNGCHPFFPILRFMGHLVTTAYGIPRMITYLILPLTVVSLLAWCVPKFTGGRMKIIVSVCASFLAPFIVTLSDAMAGGARIGWAGYLNLADASIPTYLTASASLAYLGCILILIYRGRHFG